MPYRLRKKRKERASKAEPKSKKDQSTSEETAVESMSKEVDEQLDEPATTIPGDTIEAPDSSAIQRTDPDAEEDEQEFSESDSENLRVVSAIQPRKTKFFFNTEKAPKDRQVGSTTYRVTKTTSKNLAPKFNPNAKSMKETLLYGRSGKKQASNRKPMRPSFFKK
jgi:hypothetical protein